MYRHGVDHIYSFDLIFVQACSRVDLISGVISRGAQGGGAPLVNILDHSGGAQPPLEILALALLFKVY